MPKPLQVASKAIAAVVGLLTAAAACAKNAASRRGNRVLLAA